MRFEDSDGGFGPEMVSIEKRCTSCGEIFKRCVSKESSNRQRFCYKCRINGWIPVIHVLKIGHEESRDSS